MAKNRIVCIACHAEALVKDVLALNKKLLGEDLQKFYCINCLAAYLDCSVEDLFAKIAESKAEGCKLFS